MKVRVLFVRSMLAILASIGSVAAIPVITDFSPTVGAPGDQVLLTGSGFSSGGFTIRFWNGGSGVPAASVFINSDTLITVTVPSGITTGYISIQVGTQSPTYTTNKFLAIGSGPYISGFSPVFGAVGDTVTVNGVHFANTTGVLFHGTSALEVAVNAAGSNITTRVPAGATTGPITVTTSKGASNSLSSFTVIGPGPFITDFSPISGDGGTKVMINGRHFTSANKVTFNGKTGVILLATSDTSIQAQAPAGVTTGPIAVTTPSGSEATSSNFFGKPSITGFSPIFGRANTNVSLAGNNFDGATAVSFGQVSASFSVVNNSNISVSVPAGATTGFILVTVPGALAISTTNFVVRPAISGFSPIFGPVGSSVTITGANLNASAPVVRFSGVQAAAPTGVTFGQLTAQVPAGATTGPISVTTVDGSDTNANLFFLPATIKSFTPTNSGPGSRIAITGTNFSGATGVSFNGTSATAFTITNNGSIGATVPAGVITGPISVTTPAGAVLSSGLFYGAPVITNFTPTHGLPGTNVTIQGVNFLGGTVEFNGLKAAITSLSNAQIVATVPSGAKTGPITIIGPAGTNTSVGNFTLDYGSNLRVSITNSPNPVTIGSNLVYTISIDNLGPYPAPSVTFTNILPPTVTLRKVVISAPWLLMTNGNILTGSVSNWSGGSSAALTITVAPQLAGNITNTITIASDNPDSVPGDNTASIITTVEPLALLSIGFPARQVKISWPVALTNYVLQFEDSLTPSPHWSTVTISPAISGGVKFVIETNTSATRLYRLKK